MALEFTMKPYFQAHLGEVLTLPVSISTDPAGVRQQRTFFAEVLYLTSAEVVVNLVCRDEFLTPSGFQATGKAPTQVMLGDYAVPLDNLVGLKCFWVNLMERADPAVVDLI